MNYIVGEECGRNLEKVVHSEVKEVSRDVVESTIKSRGDSYPKSSPRLLHDDGRRKRVRGKKKG